MRKYIYLFIVAMAMSSLVNAQRFISEIFPTATSTLNVTYGKNISIFPAAPGLIDLKMDVYEPGGMADPMPARPLIVFMHTGSYIPALINGSPTGSRFDSATVEICKQFARRGYVVANIDYRMGWNPYGSTVDIRCGSLLQAVYRSIQDAKAAVRFFKADAAGANTYKIDSTKIIMGGQGTGGYMALNYVTLHDSAQLQLAKFISSTTDPTYGLQAGFCYINTAAMGDIDGHGGSATYNYDNNSLGHTNNVQFAFNLGGALGDSSWLTAGDAPMISFHCPTDPFAPYIQGMVYVPVVNQAVVYVYGGGWVIPRANALGNNNCFLPPPAYNDAYTARANAVNGGADGWFPLVTDSTEGSPWEWFDSTATVTVGTAPPYNYTVAHCDSIYHNALATNWNMSKTKALKYIDTIMNYLNPRLQRCLGLPLWAAGVNQTTLSVNDMKIFPNPTSGDVNVESNGIAISSIKVSDITGRIIRSLNELNALQAKVNMSGISPGVYFITIDTKAGSITRKLAVQ